MFMVMERGDKGTNRFVLTYYNYLNLSEESKPAVRWEVQENPEDLPKRIAKIDNHSKIAFWSYQQGE